MLLGWSLHSLFPVIEQFGGIAADFLFMSQAAVRRFGCGFHGTVYGMGAMCIAMLANYIPRYRAKEITLKSRVPMGPFLLVWLCTGVPLGCIM